MPRPKPTKHLRFRAAADIRTVSRRPVDSNRRIDRESGIAYQHIAVEQRTQRNVAQTGSAARIDRAGHTDRFAERQPCNDAQSNGIGQGTGQSGYSSDCDSGCEGANTGTANLPRRV